MEIITDKRLEELNYPTGVYMKNNLPIINYMAEILNNLYPDDEISIFCRGSSGAIIAGIIASKIPRCNISYIRKEGENSHSSRVSLMDSHRTKNIIVDDFISTGKTIKAIFKDLEDRVHIDCILITGGILKDMIFESDLLICERIYL